MVLLYGECGRKARSAARYRERFSAGPHPSYQAILSVVKRLTGCVINRARFGRSPKVGRRVKPNEVLAYTLAYCNAVQDRPMNIVASQKIRFGNSYKNQALIHTDQRLSMFY